MGSRAQVLAWASHTKPRLKSKALRLYFLCSMHTGQPISFFSMAVLDGGQSERVRFLPPLSLSALPADPSAQLGPHTVMSLFCSSGLVMMYTWTVSNSSREMKSSGTWGGEWQ